MRSLRSVALLVLLTFITGPALLDRCLISCHDETPAQAAVPPCHSASSSDEPSLSGVGACGHDHEGLQADRVSDLRQAGALYALHLAVLPVVSAIRPAGPGSAVRLKSGVPLALVPVSLDLPLRV